MTVTETNYTRTLAEYASGLRYEEVPAEAIEQAKKIVLHTIGVSLASRGMEPTANSAALATARGGHPEATLWGIAGARVPVQEAVFANGTAADVLDWEDCTWTGHASAAAIPAAFAVGEQRRCRGRDVLTAIVASYEVYQRIAMAVQPDFDSYVAEGRGWGLVNWQSFAAAVAAGRLADLDAGQMAAALSLAAYMAPTLMGKDGDGDAYHYAHGIAAKSGVNSVEITKTGFEYFDDGLDGATGYWRYVSNQCDWEWMDRELGGRFYITETLLKHWPANVWVQAPLDALDSIWRAQQLSLSDIEKIRVSPKIDIVSAQGSFPLGLLQAEYSLPHCFACYLSDLQPSAEWYTSESRSDAGLHEISQLVEYVGPKASALHMFEVFWEGSFPETVVEVVTKDGSVHREELRYPKGHPRNNFTMADEKEFFVARAVEVIGKEHAQRFADAVERLEECQDLNQVTALLMR